MDFDKEFLCKQVKNWKWWLVVVLISPLITLVLGLAILSYTLIAIGEFLDPERLPASKRLNKLFEWATKE